MGSAIRVLLVADSHLGFDLPSRARVERRRRGPDFFRCFRRALEPALRGEVDLVVHGGDLLFRSRVGAPLVAMAIEPLREVADRGVPVLLVPGNHERSALPFPILAAHPRIHLFDRPRTHLFEVRGERVAAGGFPFERQARARFPGLVREAGLLCAEAPLRLLCMHQAVEGAKVGPGDFTFRGGDDVVRAADLPGGVAAVLSGHIHRGQVLVRDLAGAPLRSPVLYPGSVERTSFAEKDEGKACLVVTLEPAERGGRLGGWRWLPLPARPMVELPLESDAPEQLLGELSARALRLPADAVVRIRLPPGAGDELAAALTAERIRRAVPATMNVSLPLRGRRQPPGGD